MGDRVRKRENGVEREDDRVLIVERYATIVVRCLKVVGLTMTVDDRIVVVVVVGLMDVLHRRQRKNGDAAREHRRDDRGRGHSA